MKHGIYRVTDWEIVGPRTLTVRFDDNTCQTIDFSPAMKGTLYSALRDEAFFRRVKLDREFHTLVWPNGADFDPATLHDWHQTSWGTQVEAKTIVSRVAETRAGYGTRKRRKAIVRQGKETKLIK